jgi:large subunit ribosomal protein L18
MAHGKNQRLRFKRRRDGETDYRRRMKLLRGETPRAVVRISNTQTICQLVEFNPDGDIVIASVNGKTLVDKYSWPEDASRKSIPASYLDIGLSASSKGSRVFAALKGMIDAGLEIPHGEDVLPDEDRINGMHIDASMGDKVKKSIKAIEEA